MMIMMHGFGGNRTNWDDQWPLFGHSSKIEQPGRFNRAVVAFLIEQQNLAR